MEQIKFGRKRISFGKIAAYGKAKINEVTVDIELKANEEGKPVFSASAMVWNSRHTDCVMGGQCLDTLYKKYFLNNPVFQEIYFLWCHNHLNDMHAGTVVQESALEQADVNGIDVSDYTKACEYLKSVGLYEVLNDGEMYKYGHGWLYRDIPEEDLEKIQKYVA